MRTIKFGIIGWGLMGREFASAVARWCHLPDMDYGRIVGESLYAAMSFDPTGNGNNLSLGAGAAHSINDNDQIVGISAQAILFDATGQQNNTNLGTLGGAGSIARSINNEGQIVGIAWTKESNRRATLFDPSGSSNNIDLGTLGRANSDALCINNKGQAVGVVYQGSEHVAGDAYATLFDITGQGNNFLLNTLIDPTCGWNLMSAKGINDNGWIVGLGVNPVGEYHAFLLTPIPEPATLLLLCLGGVLLRKRA